MEKSEYHFKFEDLIVYQKAIEFGEVVHSQISGFPKQGYRLSAQFARTTDPIAFNIGQGSGSSDAGFLNSLRIASDSSRKCVAAITKAISRNNITFEQRESDRELLVEINKMLPGLIKHLENPPNYYPLSTNYRPLS